MVCNSNAVISANCKEGHKSIISECDVMKYLKSTTESTYPWHLILCPSTRLIKLSLANNTKKKIYKTKESYFSLTEKNFNEFEKSFVEN